MTSAPITLQELDEIDVGRLKGVGDVKRKALSYWSCNRRSLGIRLADFLRACSIDSSECRIVFTFPSAK